MTDKINYDKLQDDIRKAIDNSLQKWTDNDPNIFEFVATYDAGILTRYIGG